MRSFALETVHGLGDGVLRLHTSCIDLGLEVGDGDVAKKRTSGAIDYGEVCIVPLEATHEGPRD